ncbi:ATP-binding protein [Roseicyclus marinus]|uniref:ATP-binding protein n=1 Tax=Roseicyclus marinus TaxID=2161673 RepID=UPI00240EAA88|nr:ATP-binding protein [Roseicyclus marinus]MDG3039784.1 ATP-binding protein [Roseicyclus marinus]
MTPYPEKSILVERDLSAVAHAACIVRDFAQSHLDELLAGDVELAVVETLTNAIKHGQVHNRDDNDILITLKLDGPDLVVDIFDHAPLVPPDSFDRIAADHLDMDPANLDSLTESGRGLALILLSMDEVTLHADDALFRLHMRKRIP